MDLAVNRDDAVVVKPEDFQVLVPIFHTATACAGSATAYVLRRIAYRAGAYAPGIQEQVFHELNTSRDGGSIERVQTWFASRGGMLAELGYRLQCRRAAIPTSALLDWVKQGKGYRGAMLPTSFSRLHGTMDAVDHAVGITVEKLGAKGDDELAMIDPWPIDQPDRGKLSPKLDAAHRDRNYQALVFYWIGWS